MPSAVSGWVCSAPSLRSASAYSTDFWAVRPNLRLANQIQPINQNRSDSKTSAPRPRRDRSGPLNLVRLKLKSWKDIGGRENADEGATGTKRGLGRMGNAGSVESIAPRNYRSRIRSDSAALFLLHRSLEARLLQHYR